MQQRIFGRSGENLPFLGLGCQRLVDTSNCPEDLALQILETALDGGIRYFDTAWVYGLGQAERRVGQIARRRRGDMWISTKTTDRSRDGALLQLEHSLSRLQTGTVDEWRLHNISDMESLEECFRPGGAIEAVIKAKQEGLVRYASISGHGHPSVQIEALRRFPFDSVMVPTSVFDHFIYSPEEELLPLANEDGAAVIGMKALGLGKLSGHFAQALRYNLGLPISVLVVGCSKVEELEKDLDLARQFTPLDDQEREDFFQKVKPLVIPKNVPWKALDWGKRNEWIRP